MFTLTCATFVTGNGPRELGPIVCSGQMQSIGRLSADSVTFGRCTHSFSRVVVASRRVERIQTDFLRGSIF